MRLLLGLNTATTRTEIAFLTENKILEEDSWEAKADESEKILPYLQKSLKELQLSFSDLTELFVIKGPGHFTALRVGITIINTLAYLLDLPIFTTDAFEMISHRSQLKNSHLVILPAAGQVKLWDRFPDRYSKPEIGLEVPDDLPQAIPKLSFGEFLLERNFKQFKKYHNALLSLGGKPEGINDSHWGALETIYGDLK